MITLTDKLQNKNIKIGIDGLSGPISKRISIIMVHGPTKY